MNGMDWLVNDRKIGIDLLESIGVKVSQQREDVIAFPYRRDGRVHAWKYRTINKRFWSTEGQTRGLFNADDLRHLPDHPIVLTEGEIDCLSVIQAGFDRAVSLPDGWTTEGNKRDCLVEAEEALRRSPFVIVAGDTDEAGESLPRAVAQVLQGHDVRFCSYPDGCKDANDVLVKHGEGVLAACLHAAKRIDPPGGMITAFSDLPPLSERRVLRTGMKPVDWAVAMQLGALSVWTGIPGHGKSTFLVWALEKLSINESVRVGLLAFETHPHDIRDQLSLIRSGREFCDLPDSMRGDFLRSVDERFRLVHVKFEDDQEQHLKWLEEIIYALAVRDGCKVVVIDPWNELEHMPLPGENMTQYINFATKFLRQIAEKLEIHIALVAHPKKINSEGKLRAPTGYDVADSAAFFNKPSLGVTVHQDQNEEGEPVVDLHVWKVRNTRLYKLNKGRVRLEFDRVNMSYREPQGAVQR